MWPPDFSHGVVCNLTGRAGLPPEPYWLALTLYIVPNTTLPALAAQALHDPMAELAELAAASGQRGCAYCGGLGHRIADCPKLQTQNREQQRKSKDYFGSAGGFGAEM